MLTLRKGAAGTGPTVSITRLPTAPPHSGPKGAGPSRILAPVCPVLAVQKMEGSLPLKGLRPHQKGLNTNGEGHVHFFFFFCLFVHSFIHSGKLYDPPEAWNHTSTETELPKTLG